MLMSEFQTVNVRISKFQMAIWAIDSDQVTCPDSFIHTMRCPGIPSVRFKPKNVCFSFTYLMNGLVQVTASNKRLPPRMVTQAHQGKLGKCARAFIM